MDKKKVILVIVLATILALLAAFGVMKFSNNDVKQIEPQTEVVNEEETSLNTEEITDTEVKEESETEVVEQKPIQVVQPQKEVKTVVKPVIKEDLPVVKPLQVEEVKVVENSIEENNKDCGILKDSGTNEIVITREFKTTTPNKYSFK